MAGICLISFNGTRFALSPKGDILAVLAALAWACYSILIRKAAEFGVRGIPTIIAFKKGRAVDQRTGACDQATLDAFIEKNL